MNTYFKVSDNGFYTEKGKEIFTNLDEAIFKAQQLVTKYPFRMLPPVEVVEFTEQKGSSSRLTVWRADLQWL